MKTIGNKSALQFALEEMSKKNTGVQPGEFTMQDMLNAMEKPVATRTMFGRLRKMVKNGKLHMRKASINGNLTNIYSYAPGQDR